MICKDRVVIVTGAGRGIGREHALLFAREGAKVVVNDLGTSGRGEGEDVGPAQAVVHEIRALGGEAVASGHDITDWSACADLLKLAIDTFGDLHVVVNNAGILRDRMFVSSTEDEWEAVMRVHVMGHVALTRHACGYWRGQSKAGVSVDARIINTSSGAGLQGSIGQSAYATAKGGIASLTLVQAAELGRYGVTSNAIAPAARTRMTEGPFADMMKKPDDGFDVWAPDNISPIVVWLGSESSRHVTGRVFETVGGKLSVADAWRPGPGFDKGARLEASEVGSVVADLLERSVTPAPVYGT